MSHKKTLKELILQIPIEKVDVCKEKSVVIFICDFDPFGKERYCYTFESRCRELSTVSMQDGSRTIFLSTRGKNKDEVPEAMVRFLEFVRADLEESTRDFGDDFVSSLQQSVGQVKKSRAMEERYMILHEMLQDERAEGKAEYVITRIKKCYMENVRLSLQI